MGGACSSRSSTVDPPPLRTDEVHHDERLRLRAHVVAQKRQQREELRRDGVRNDPQQQMAWQLATSRLHAWIRQREQRGQLDAADWREEVPPKNREAFELFVAREPLLAGEPITFTRVHRRATRHDWGNHWSCKPITFTQVDDGIVTRHYLGYHWTAQESAAVVVNYGVPPACVC